MNWGTLSDSTASDDAILLGDCAPHTLDSYESYVADRKKLESHGQHTELFGLLYGKERREERRDALGIMIELREYRPDLFTIAFLCQSWEAMAYAYISAIEDDTRRMIRTLPDAVQKPDLRRKSFSPGPTGHVLWEYHTTWKMPHPTGYWQPTVKPKLEERAPRATWETILSSGLKEKRGGGDEEVSENQYKINTPPGYLFLRKRSVLLDLPAP